MTTASNAFVGAHLMAADEEWEDVREPSLWLAGFGPDDAPDLSELGRLFGRLAATAPDSGFVEASGFAFLLRHVERGELMGVVLDDELRVALTVGEHVDEQGATELAHAFASFLDTVEPADCAMPYSTKGEELVFGVRNGVPFGGLRDTTPP